MPVQPGPERSPEAILILGIGNVLMGDEGVGVHAIRYLEQEETFPGHVRLLDGGTGGFHLLSYLHDYSRIIMIDATMDGTSAGTVRVLTPRFASDFPRALSAHDIGLRDLVETAALTRSLPSIHLITVSIDSIQPMTMELSDAARLALPLVASEIRSIIATLSTA